MGITSSLYIAISGMNMSQAGMEVASHNIANVNTPGYSRQRLNLETNPTWKSGSYGQMGTGVNAQNIARFHDEFLTRSIITKGSEYGAAAAKKSAIDSLEAFFNESSGNGINAALNDFFGMWDSVSAAAEINPTREEMVSIAQTLADQLHMRRQDMDAVRTDLNSRLESAVSDINKIIESIAGLNQQIMRDENPSRNQQSNDLRDAREALLIQLGEMIDINFWEDPTNGAVNVTFKDGPALVANATAYQVGVQTDESGDIHIIANNRRTAPPWPEDVTGKIKGGTVGGWIEFRDDTLRDFYLQYESFVDNLMFQVNNQHAQGAGLDLFTSADGTSLASNLPSYTFSFDGQDNDLKISALVPHLDNREPYREESDPENIAVRFAKSDRLTNEITSEVNWNDDPAVRKWEITIYLPTDSNGNVTATAEDVIRHINNEKSTTSTSTGVASLPPKGVTWPYKVGDFISAQAASGENWTGTINFGTKTVPSNKDQYASLDRSLANVMGQGHHLSYGSEKAGLTTNLKHTDNDVVFTALDDGAAGERICVEYVNSGPNQQLGVTVYTEVDGASRISVTLATNDEGKVTTTAADIVNLIKNDPAARDLVSVRTADDQLGEGLVQEMDAAYLDRSGSFEIVTYEKGEPTVSRIIVDPTDTLRDVVNRIGTTFDDGVKGVRAEIITDQNGQDSIRIIANAQDGFEFGFRNDTSGALAVLGLNNIFTGDSSNNIGVNQNLVDNPRLLAAGRIDVDGVRESGDNVNGLDMADLKDKRFSFYRLSSGTLGTAFNTFYANIGSENRAVTTTHDFLYGILDEMHSKVDNLAGVNLDEELADVLRYQYMYQASAKMISTIDEMMSTLLAMR